MLFSTVGRGGGGGGNLTTLFNVQWAGGGPLVRPARSVPADDAQRPLPDPQLQAVRTFEKKRTRSPVSGSLCILYPLDRTYQVPQNKTNKASTNRL